MEDKIKVILDTDPGVDDTIALMFFMFDPRIDVKLITTVSGNRPLEINSRNTMHLLEKFGRCDIPVALGANKPLKRARKDASFIHSASGMGHYTPTEPTKIKPIKDPAWEAMYKTIMENKNEIIICLQGPHTNMAKCLMAHPDCAQYVKQIIYEGGSPYGYKGIAPHISFNASSDPEAMKIVLESGIPIVMIPSEMGRVHTYLSYKQVMKIENANDVGKFIGEMFDAYWEPGYEDKRIAMNDSCIYFYLVEPKMFKGYRADIDLDIKEFPGKTVMDFKKDGKYLILMSAKRNRSFKYLYSLVKKLDDYKFYE